MWEGLWVGGKDSVTSWLRVGGGTKKPRRAQHGVDDKEQHTTTVVRGGVRGAGWAWAHKRRNADMIFTFHAEKTHLQATPAATAGRCRPSAAVIEGLPAFDAEAVVGWWRPGGRGEEGG